MENKNVNVEKLMETKEGVQLLSATLTLERLDTVTQQLYRRKKQLKRFTEYAEEGVPNAKERVEEIKIKIEELNEEIKNLSKNLLALYK